MHKGSVHNTILTFFSFAKLNGSNIWDSYKHKRFTYAITFNYVLLTFSGCHFRLLGSCWSSVENCAYRGILDRRKFYDQGKEKLPPSLPGVLTILFKKELPLHLMKMFFWDTSGLSIILTVHCSVVIIGKVNEIEIKFVEISLCSYQRTSYLCKLRIC